MNVFEDLYTANRQGIYNYFLRVSGDSHLAQDLSQDTFLRAFRFFAGFRGDSSARTWLTRIAINVWKSHTAKTAPELTVIPDYIPDPRDAIAASTESIIIQQVFNQLDEKERTFILLSENGLTYQQIADVLELTEGQVRIGLHRARKKFRNLYMELGREDKDEARL